MYMEYLGFIKHHYYIGNENHTFDDILILNKINIISYSYIT